MEGKDTLFFTGMDMDSDPRLLGQEKSYRKAEGLHLSETSSGKKGALQRIKGNVQVLWAPPPGLNTCIGTLWDEQDNSQIAFIYNNQRNDSIIRYYPDRPGAGEIELVAQGDLGFDKDHLISSSNLIDGEYLYWVDGKNVDRMINIKKANMTNKKVCLRIYFPKEVPEFDWSAFWKRSFSVVSITNGATVISGATFYEPLAEDVREFTTMVTGYADAWNNQTTLKKYFRAEACGDYVEICALKDGEDWNVNLVYVDWNPTPGPAQTMWAVYSNRYVNTWTREQLDAVPYPPACPPTLTFGRDTTRNQTFLERTVFQFAIAYKTSNDERTFMGPPSDVAVELEDLCNPSPTKSDNYIEIDFTDARLSDLASLSRISGVAIFMREGNIGVWKSVTVLGQADFIYKNTFRFYNDSHYPPIDAIYSSVSANSAPIRSNAQEYISDQSGDGRLVKGGTTEGYDNVCVDAVLDLNFDDTDGLIGNTGSITGTVKILNPFDGTSLTYGGGRFNEVQPIHDLRTDHNPGGAPSHIGTVFGGFGPDDVVNRVGHKYNQWLPEGGFTIYAAGTKHYAISEQQRLSGPNNNPTYMGGTNVYDSGKGSRRKAIRDAIKNHATGPYSTFRMSGLAPGKYVIRVASHLCSRGDVLGRGSVYDLDKSEWQKTSTYTIQVGSNSNTNVAPGITEAVVTIPPTGGNIDIGEILITDLTNIKFGVDSIAFSAYLYDNDAEPDAASQGLQLLENGDPMDRQNVYARKVDVAGAIVGTYIGLIGYYNPAYFWINILKVGTAFDAWSRLFTKQEMVSDHNGFVWFTEASGLTITSFFTNWEAITIGAIGVTGDPSITSPSYPSGVSTNPGWEQDFMKIRDFDDLIYQASIGSSSPLTQISDGKLHKTDEHIEYIIHNSNPDITTFGRTSIDITATNANGVGVSDVLAVLGRGQWATTDPNGAATITVYGDVDDSSSPNPGNKRTQDDLYLVTDLACATTFSTGDTIDIQITQFEESSEYSEADTLAISTVVSFVSSNVNNSLKRGATYDIGIGYKDEVGRVSPIWHVKTQYIPFFTEDLNAWDAIKYPVAGTYETGRPELSWTINSDVPIPDVGRFTHYQWYRTPNTAASWYTQWAVSQVQYVESVEGTTLNLTSYGSSSAKEIYLDIGTSFTKFAGENSDSQVGYTFTEGDRVRLILDDNGDAFTDNFDMPIRGVDASGKKIIIEHLLAIPELKQGVVVEVYSPKLDLEEKIYNEWAGECYPITDPYGSNPMHSVTSGLFGSGDAWFRPRDMPVEDDSGNFARFVYFVEDHSVSDFYASMDSGIGKVNTENSDAKQRLRPTAKRISNPFIQNADTNDLGIFEGLNVRVSDINYGLIQRMIKAGKVLVNIHSNRRTVTNYLGKVMIQDAGETNLLALSNEILGDDIELLQHYGTLNPESVVEHAGRIYYFDVRDGVVVRYGRDGLTPISMYKMKSYFADKGRQLKSGLSGVVGTYDVFYDEYVLTFPEIPTVINGIDTAIPAETVAFHEPSNRWTSFYPFTPEMLGRVGKDITSFKDGSLYIHDRNDNYGEFYGVQTASAITMVPSMPPTQIKVWLSMLLDSLSAWDAPTIINDRGQDSELSKTDMREREGEFAVDFLRDKNTPNVALPLLDGDHLRSHYLEITLSDDSPDDNWLVRADIYYNVSERDADN